MGLKPIVMASALAMGFGALWAAPALGAGPTTAATAEAQPEAAPNIPGRKICRSVIRSGTRLSTRFCRTQAEWDKSGEDARRMLQQGQNEGPSRDAEMNEARGAFPSRQ